MEGRKSTNVGRVLELVSEGKVNQFACTVDGTWRYYKDGELSFSYTWNAVSYTHLGGAFRQDDERHGGGTDAYGERKSV